MKRRKEERIWNKKKNTKKLLTMRLSLESDHVMEGEKKKVLDFSVRPRKFETVKMTDREREREWKSF